MSKIILLNQKILNFISVITELLFDSINRIYMYNFLGIWFPLCITSLLIYRIYIFEKYIFFTTLWSSFYLTAFVFPNVFSLTCFFLFLFFHLKLIFIISLSLSPYFSFSFHISCLRAVFLSVVCVGDVASVRLKQCPQLLSCSEIYGFSSTLLHLAVPVL